MSVTRIFARKRKDDDDDVGRRGQGRAVNYSRDTHAAVMCVNPPSLKLSVELLHCREKKRAQRDYRSVMRDERMALFFLRMCASSSFVRNREPRRERNFENIFECLLTTASMERRSCA